MISRDHHRFDTRSDTLCHRRLRFFSRWIHHGDQPQKYKILLIVKLWNQPLFDLLICEGQNTQPILRKTLIAGSDLRLVPFCYLTHSAGSLDLRHTIKQHIYSTLRKHPVLPFGHIRLFCTFKKLGPLSCDPVARRHQLPITVKGDLTDTAARCTFRLVRNTQL